MGIEQIYNEILTEHTTSNRNKHHIENPTHVCKGVNPSCGVGCAISQASASIMIDLIKGKPVEEAMKLAKTFFGMIKHEITDEEQLEVLEDAIVLKDIGHMPARVKCAVLGWHTLEDVVGKEK